MRKASVDENLIERGNVKLYRLDKRLRASFFNLKVKKSGEFDRKFTSL